MPNKRNKKVTKKNMLSEIVTTEITLCKNPALQKNGKFLIMKSEEASKPIWKREIVFKAYDDEKQIAYGYALVPDIEDFQEDEVTKAEVEKAAHNFMEVLAKGNQIGTGTGHEHVNFEDIGHPVESAIDVDGSLAKSHGVPDELVHKGGWWVGVKMEDDYWAMAKSGDITGFSIGGDGKRTPVIEKKAITYNDGESFFTKFKKKVLNRVDESVNKALSYDDIINVQQVREAIVEKTWALYDSIWSIMDDDDVTDKLNKVKESVSQFNNDIDTLQKIAKNKTETSNIGDEEMTEEQFNKIIAGQSEVKTEFAAVAARVEKLENPPAPEENTEKTDVEKKADEVKKKAELSEEDKSEITKLKESITQLGAIVKNLVEAPGVRTSSEEDEGGEQPVKKTVNKFKGTAFSIQS